MGDRQREARRRVYGIIYRILIALVIFTGAIVKFLLEQKIWQQAPTWIFPSAVVIVAAAALRDSVTSSIQKATAPRRRRRRENVSKAVTAALAQISRDTGISIFELGASVFMIRPGTRWLPPKVREQWAWSRPYLERTLRFRLEDNPQPSDVVWFKGKGTIGQCWEFDKVRYKYWLPIAERYEDHDITDEGFVKIPAETRMELTRQEFCSIVGKYAEILAVPVKQEHGRMVGVLSVDLAKRNRIRDQGESLSGNDVESILTTAAVVIEKNR